MVAAFLYDGMPTMMSALPSLATASRSAGGRSEVAIEQTLLHPGHRSGGRSDDAGRRLGEDQSRPVDRRCRCWARAAEDVQLPRPGVEAGRAQAGGQVLVDAICLQSEADRFVG